MRRIFLMMSLGSSILFVVFGFAGQARAAVTIVYQRGTGPVATVYVDGGHMRMENPGRNEREDAVVVDAAGKRVIMIDDKNKTYMEMTQEDRQRMRAQVEAMRAQMQERMKSMPPQQREKMEAMMGPAAGQKPRDWTYKALGQKKTINGISCEMYQVTEDGKPREEDCIAPWSAGLVKKDDFAAIAKFAQEMLADVGAQGRARAEGGAMIARLEKAPGMPISRVPLEADGTRGEEEQIKSIKRGPVAASLFAIPAGFTKKELPMMMGPGGRHAGPPSP